MREFKDNEGRPWRLALTCSAVLRVPSMVTIQVDELDASGQPTGKKQSVPFEIAEGSMIGKTFDVLHNNYPKVGEVLYAILISQVEERNLTKEQFLDGLSGDSLEAGAKALEEELIDFFPLRRRRIVGLIAAKMREAESDLESKAEAQLTEFKVQDLPGTPSGKQQESSESTPANGPSDSSSQPAKAA